MYFLSRSELTHPEAEQVALVLLKSVKLQVCNSCEVQDIENVCSSSASGLGFHSAQLG